MGIFHFLNVKHGDCSIIEHPNGHVTVIDVCNARHQTPFNELADYLARADGNALKGDFGQKDHPVNPIEYMKGRNIKNIFRFINTHPDMDHLDGIKDLFEAFTVWNFWSTDNTCGKDFGDNSPYREEDWDHYVSLRDGTLQGGPTGLKLHSGARGQYYNVGEDGTPGGDGIHVLAPTPELISAANDSGDHNDCSYAILYRSNAGRILVMGDAHDKTMEHVLAHHAADVKDIDLLVAPHHGRHSDRDFEFLNWMRPKLTFFGNAPSEHLAYGPWNSRELPIITNNQAGSLIVDTNGTSMHVYATNGAFARSRNSGAQWSAAHGGWYLGVIVPFERSAAE